VSVYVVTAIEDGKVIEQEVYSDLETAQRRFKDMQIPYGAANVCLASRGVLDAIPDRGAEPEPRAVYPSRGGRWA
jgi:hypothetical protein